MKRFLLLALIVFSVISCTTAQKGAGVGAVAGGALGGIIGNQSGNPGTGAAIGAAAGAITGVIVAEKMAKNFCPVCGATYNPDVKFCPKDGSELKEKQ